MLHILVSASRFSMLIFMAVYTLYSFTALKSNIKPQRQDKLYKKQTTMIYMLLINGNLVLYLLKMDQKVLILAACEMVLLFLISVIYKKIYTNASKALVNNMSMLLTVSFMILTRLDMDKAVKQFVFAAVAVVITCFIPLIVAKLEFLSKLGIFYGIIGIAGLAVVLVAAQTTYGAKLSINLGPVVLQPSEFIKIIFIFFVCLLQQSSF